MSEQCPKCEAEIVAGPMGDEVYYACRTRRTAMGLIESDGCLRRQLANVVGEINEVWMPKVAELQLEINRLRAWVSDLQSGMYINCVYCGHRYGPEDEIPTTMANALKEHIENCPEHPMSALKAEIEVRSIELDSVEASRQMWLERACAAEETIARLQHTMDGVPIIPGMAAWVQFVEHDDIDPFEIHVDAVNKYGGVIEWGTDTGQATYPRCYSTREAAEEATE